MARRNANLAGLAALGALGYQLYNQSKGKKGGAPVEDRVLEDLSDRDGGGITAIRESLEDTSDQDGGGITAIRPSAQKTVSAPPSPAMMSREEEALIRAKGGPRGTRYLPKNEPDMSAYKPRRSADQIGAPRQVGGPRPTTREERIDSIPTDAGKYAPVSGEKIDSTELGRNASNIMNATAGLSVPGYVSKMTQAQYNARAAARRAAGELTEAEIAAAKAAQREKKTLNPMAWMAGPKGMAENFKKGGAVKAKSEKAEKPSAKGWGKARGVRAAKYY
jgi:hypothetical protein